MKLYVLSYDNIPEAMEHYKKQALSLPAVLNLLDKAEKITACSNDRSLADNLAADLWIEIWIRKGHFFQGMAGKNDQILVVDKDYNGDYQFWELIVPST